MTSPIPGPRPWPIIGNLRDIDLENSIQSFSKLCLQYGPIMKVTLSGNDIVFISGHELVNELCSRKDCIKLPAASIKELQAVTPEGLFTADPGQRSWELAHKILVPAFGPLSVREMFPEMHDITSQLVLKWARFGGGARINVTSDFTRLTLDTIALCAMDTRFNSFYDEKLHSFVDAMTKILIETENRVVLPKWINWFRRGANQKFQRDVEYLHQLATEVVARRRAAPTTKADLVNYMINGCHPSTGEQLSDAMIADNMITFLIAGEVHRHNYKETSVTNGIIGHETTSGLLSFTFALLMKHPEAYQKVQQEVDSVLQGRRITAAHINRLSYIKACLRESLRLYPPSAGFPVAIKGDSLEPVLLGGKYMINRNEAVFVLLPPLHRDLNAFGDDVDEFKPERMLEENYRKLPPGCYKAFGTGVRACIGVEFAMQEAILAVALLFQKFDFHLADPDYEIVIKEALTLKPRDLYMHAKLRPGIDVLTLQESLYSGSAQLEPVRDVKSPLSSSQDIGKLISIFYGSSTGTCEGLAHHLAKCAMQRGFVSSVRTMNEAINSLHANQVSIFITSTQYEGQSPENACEFVDWLDGLKESSLSNVPCAVFGCGSSDWKSTHQKTAILVHDLLNRHGANVVAPLGTADAAQGNIIGDFDSWQVDQLWPNIEELLKITPLTTVKASETLFLGLDHLFDHQFNTEVIQIKALTTAEDRPKWQLEVELPSEITYMLGDYLEVWPRNSREDYDALLSYYQSMDKSTPDNLLVKIHDSFELGQPATLKQIKRMYDACTDQEEKTTLETALRIFSQSSERRPTIMQILKTFKGIFIPAEQLAIMLPPLRPRLYSISSSPLVSPQAVTLTWSLINHAGPKGLGGDLSRPGLASNFMTQLKPGEKIRCALRPGQRRFCPPERFDTTPVVMICAGAGIAPFRGFIQERSELMKRTKGLQDGFAAWHLYVGCTDPEHALYASEMQEWQATGVFQVHYVYSRAGPCPSYVQDSLWSDREGLVQLWDQDARIFVCGSQALSEGVKDTFLRIYREVAQQRCGLVSDDEVERWWVGILRERYIVDVWG